MIERDNAVEAPQSGSKWSRMFNTREEVIVQSRIGTTSRQDWPTTTAHSRQLSTELPKKEYFPRRLLDFSIGPAPKPARSDKPPSIVANKFEYRRYSENADSYSDLSQQLRKKECYQLFLAHKTRTRSSWNSNFQQLYGMLSRNDIHFRHNFQRLLSRQEPLLY